MLQALRDRAARVVRFGERTTKTDLSYLLKGGTWLALGQVGLGLIAFGLSLAFARFIPKDAYGTYRFLLSIFWTLTAFSLTGLPTALSRAIARGFDGTYRRAFSVSLVGSLPLFVIAFAMGAYYWWNDNLMLAAGAIIIAVLGPFMQASLLYGAFLEGKQDFKRMALYGIVLNGVAAILALGVMHFTDNPLAFLSAYLVGAVGSGLVLGLVSYRIYKPRGVVAPDFLSLSGHFSAMNLLATLSQQVDKLLVFHYLGAVQLAVYTFATALPEQVKTSVNSISTVAFPKFSSRPFSEIRKNFWNRLWLFTGLLGLIAITYVFLAPYLYAVFFPAYPEAVIYSQLFAISLLFVSNAIPLTLLEAQAAKRELYIFNIVSPLFQILALLVGIIYFGLTGVIVARIAGRMFNLALLSILTFRFSRKLT